MMPQQQQQATDLQSLRTLVFASMLLLLCLAFFMSGLYISNTDFRSKEELQANANFVKQEEQSNWSVDFSLLNLKIKKGGSDE
ncbi:hypothetical protein WAF17_02630 [Bernardetia sp. ABR2-2B]|uniref:hypothetical protein n=1 Tax=Bernardetia sp. ABR2-2B TaxID=3127472 RepID=UPI0030D0BC83